MTSKRTQAERLDAIEERLEMILHWIKLTVEQQGLLIETTGKSHKILEDMDTALRAMGEAPEDGELPDLDGVDADKINDILKALLPDQEEPRDPRTPGWGFDAYQARQEGSE